MPNPLLDPEVWPESAWRDAPLELDQIDRLFEPYIRSLSRRWLSFRPSDCPRHIWARQLPGIWTCDNCPEWRRTL